MGTTDNLIVILFVILAVDVIFLLAQTSISELNPSGTQFYDYDNSFIKDFDAGNQTIDTSHAGLALPSGESAVNEEDSSFTDMFKTGKSWFLDVTGLSYLINFLGAPVIFLSMIGLPSLFVFALGALWGGSTLFLIIAFLLGR